MTAAAADPCILVIFGASGDLTKRLLVPALYNLACDGLLAPELTLLGVSRDPLDDQALRDRLTADIKLYATRKDVDPEVWNDFVKRVHCMTGSFEDPAVYQRLAERIAALDKERQLGGNVLFYLATPPPLFGVVGQKLVDAGLHRAAGGWRRLIVEKPFGKDLSSARALNQQLLEGWKEEQIFRIDHYLGKETVQNLLAFRFSNGMFEPLWNRQNIDHIQFTVAESVGVEGRGGYYDKSGALRDMIQNHMFQMLAYLCMEPPSSFRADAVRNEKAKVLEAVRPMSADEILTSTVRGQYGPGFGPDGAPVKGYREERDVRPDSPTETFAAMRLFIDTWRWEGVPIYLRTGKALWKRGTEIVVTLKKPPEVLYRDVPEVERLDSNQLIFHIQPDQGIEVRFQAKRPGPTMSLQRVNMRFAYGESFEAARGTGYEVLLYRCMIGDATLFTRNDLVESAWRIVQPILDTWGDVQPDFPNYTAGGWGPKAAFGLMENDGRKWLEVVNRAVLERVPLFHGASATFLHTLALVLRPVVCAPGDDIVRKGDAGHEMYFVARGQVDVTDGEGKVLGTLGDGAFFGETSLIYETPRTASVRARTHCDLFVLEKPDFLKALHDHPSVARTVLEMCKGRYGLDLHAADRLKQQLAHILE